MFPISDQNGSKSILFGDAQTYLYMGSTTVPLPIISMRLVLIKQKYESFHWLQLT